MKTTLNLDERTWSRLKQEAARQKRTMSELVEAALRLLLDAEPKPTDLPPLPKWSMGVALVDISDRNALYDAMDDF